MDNNDDMKNIANNVLFFFGSGGYQAGSFTASLLQTISLADPRNQYILSKSYPLESMMMNLAMNDENGIEKIKNFAQG